MAKDKKIDPLIIIPIFFLISMFALLAWAGWALFIQPIVGEKPIHKAAEEGDLNKVQELLKQGVPIDLKGPYGYTPLRLALRRGHIKVSKYLLDKGASVHDTLGFAICTGDLEIVKTVIERGEKMRPDSLAQGVSGGGISGERLELVDYLIKHGADINATYSCIKDDREFKKYSALHFAVYRRDFGLTEYLIDKGADINALTGDGLSPLGLTGAHTIGGGTGPGIHYYSEVPASPEMAALIKSKSAR